MKTIDVGLMLDEGPWSGYQKLLVIGTALTIVLDGLDNQLLSPRRIPAMMRGGAWGGRRSHRSSRPAWSA